MNTWRNVGFLGTFLQVLIKLKISIVNNTHKKIQ